MNDRALLEAAARAAGIEVHESDDGTMQRRPILAMHHLVQGQSYGEYEWNPLKDDAQALRLAVRCAQLFGFHRFMSAWLVAMATCGGSQDDPCDATRLAIVRAAAAIGSERG